MNAEEMTEHITQESLDDADDIRDSILSRLDSDEFDSAYIAVLDGGEFEVLVFDAYDDEQRRIAEEAVVVADAAAALFTTGSAYDESMFSVCKQPARYEHLGELLGHIAFDLMTKKMDGEIETDDSVPVEDIAPIPRAHHAAATFVHRFID